jgi:hypothetical protein
MLISATIGSKVPTSEPKNTKQDPASAKRVTWLFSPKELTSMPTTTASKEPAFFVFWVCFFPFLFFA